MVKFFILMMFIFLHCVIRGVAINFPELKLLSVIFRHGDREPADDVVGDLTNTGRQRSYQLGSRLREKYDAFLGDVYEASSCTSRSTEYARAKMSLQLVLAALYAPDVGTAQRWHETLAWQPIPFAYASATDDLLLFPKLCPRFVRQLDRYMSSTEYLELLEPYREMLNELSIATGEPVRNSHDMFILHHKLTALRGMNRTLPDWANDYYPDGLLLNGTYLHYDVLKHTDYMRKVNGGALVRKILDDMLNKIEEENLSTKLFLYSSHEMIITAVLETLDIWNPKHIPEYTSAILLELREDRKNYFVKVLYYTGIPSEFRDMQIPGCPALCPLDRFIESMADRLPERDEMICDG